MTSNRSANTGPDNEPVPEDKRILRIGPGTIIKYPYRSFVAIKQLLSTPKFWQLCGWIIKEAATDLLRLPLRLAPAALLPRYRSLPKALRRYARYAECKLRALRWTYLGLSLTYQLELTRAQIPLQRVGHCIEHLTSMLVICHHAALQDKSQQDVALLQAQLLKDKFDGIKILSSLRELRRTQSAVAAVGDAIESEECSLLADIEAEAFGHPWDEDD